MSIVGPRPHAAAHDHYYERSDRSLCLPPSYEAGITGWAQGQWFAVARRQHLERMEERVDYDIWYVDNWSVLLDLKIIFSTVIELFRGRNAY